MGQLEHTYYVKMKNAEEKVKRNPSFSSYKEDYTKSKIKWYESKQKEKENEELSKNIWGF